MRPMSPAGNPFPSILFHVFPPSVVFQRLLPGPPPLKPCAVRRR